MKKIYIFTLITVFTMGCVGLNDDKYFNGNIVIIEDIPEIIQLKAENLFFTDDGSNNGKVAVYDSLLIFFNPKLPTAFFSVTDIKSKKNMGIYCLKGRGPLESSALTPIYDFFEENGQLKTILSASNEDRLIIWNITESILRHETVFDNIIPYEWRKEHSTPYHNIYKLDDNDILAYVPPHMNASNDGASSLPYYQKRTLFTNEFKENFEIFLTPIRNKDVPEIQRQLFRSQDCIKPDKSKLVQSMSYLAQINIIDLHFKNVTGFRIKGSPDFSIFANKMSRAYKYYCDCQADDNYIYSLYAETLIFPKDGMFEQPQLLHVFNWAGQFVGRYDLGHKVDYISLDRQNNILYAINERTEEIYIYNLHDL